MIGPNLIARMKETNCAARFRIVDYLPSFFTQRTGHTGKSQVRKARWTAIGQRYDMIDVKSRLLAILRKATILAAISGSQ